MITFIYPVMNLLHAAKEFNCSHCGSAVSKGHWFYRTNHGRYCPNCKRQAQHENAHAGIKSQA